jgi:protein-tyrosine-phosphatase
MFPAEIKVWSAGSQPTRVRPEAITVLKEIGIDISGHRSKNVTEIPPDEVDTVITLCGEEECPVFLGKALRLHWGMPDPAPSDPAADPAAVLAGFREVRDGIRQKLVDFLAASGLDPKGSP